MLTKGQKENLMQNSQDKWKKYLLSEFVCTQASFDKLSPYLSKLLIEVIEKELEPLLQKLQKQYKNDPCTGLTKFSQEVVNRYPKASNEDKWVALWYIDKALNNWFSECEDIHTQEDLFSKIKMPSATEKAKPVRYGKIPKSWGQPKKRKKVVALKPFGGAKIDIDKATRALRHALLALSTKDELVVVLTKNIKITNEKGESEDLPSWVNYTVTPKGRNININPTVGKARDIPRKTIVQGLASPAAISSIDFNKSQIFFRSKKYFSLKQFVDEYSQQQTKKTSAIIIYTADYCNACKRAKLYMSRKKIKHTEIDVNKVPSARADLKAIIKKQGLAIKLGWPIFLINNKVVKGFGAKTKALINKAAGISAVKPRPRPQDTVIPNTFFNWGEFIKNKKYHGDTISGETIKTNITKLAQNLTIIRNSVGPLTITLNGGYRTKAQNDSKGGAKNSFHMRGQAADIYAAPGWAQVNYKKLMMILTKESKKPIDLRAAKSLVLAYHIATLIAKGELDGGRIIFYPVLGHVHYDTGAPNKIMMNKRGNEKHKTWMFTLLSRYAKQKKNSTMENLAKNFDEALSIIDRD